MALPMAPTNAAPQNPAFLNMVSLFLSSQGQTATPSEENASPTTASPTQLADAMIRSMLGGLSSGSTSSSSTNLAIPMGTQPVTPEAMLGSLPTGPTDPSLTVAPKTGTPVADSAADAPKQLRSAAELPTLTAMIAPVLTPVAPAPVAPAQNPPASGSSSNMIPSAGTRQLTAPAPLAALLPKSAIAFTAILTPMKDVDVPASTSDAARPTGTAPVAIPSSIAAQTETVPSTPAEPTATHNLQVQPAAQAVGKESAGTQTGSSMQQDDAPPQEQNDSTGTQARINAVTDTKAKPAALDQDDDGAANPTHDRASEIFAAPSLTSFPDQARATAASSGTTPPTPAPGPFQSTAEALRTSEPNLPADPPIRTGAAQEIAIRIEQPDSSTIDLRVVERSGQLHVDVRTSDAGMQTSLRQDLGTLTGSLERAGYHSETFTPSTNLARAQSSGQTGNGDDQDSSQNRNGAGDFSGGRRQQQQQQKRPSTWLEEMED